MVGEAFLGGGFQWDRSLVRVRLLQRTFVSWLLRWRERGKPQLGWQLPSSAT